MPYLSRGKEEQLDANRTRNRGTQPDVAGNYERPTQMQHFFSSLPSGTLVDSS